MSTKRDEILVHNEEEVIYITFHLLNKCTLTIILLFSINTHSDDFICHEIIKIVLNVIHVAG